ncbi:Cyclin-C [Cricetulus griseus]|uniref:Cyclin-C n=1 Tax=Cricetulus griseus TaxID=10029 RepID=G3HIW0_CRIGR|nr:Cyclin-C [Cricetulus griseus]
MPRRIQKKNCKAAEIQKVPALGRSSRESGSPPRASASACSSSGLRPPASLVSVCSLSPALRRAGTFVIRNRCTQFRVADRRLGDDGAVLFLRRRSLRSSAQPAWLRSAPGWTGSMVAPWAALLAGAFVSGPAVFHGRELLAELPLEFGVVSNTRLIAATTSVSCLHVACVVQQKDARQWFAELSVDMEKILEIIRVILKLYEQWKNFDERKEMATILSKMPKPKPPPNSEGEQGPNGSQNSSYSQS